MKGISAGLIGVGLVAGLVAPGARVGPTPRPPIIGPIPVTHVAWGAAHAVPGLAALTPYAAAVAAVSCTAPGACAAGGWSVTMRPLQQRAFVVGEVDGTWGQASQLSIAPSLNVGRWAAVTALSCASPGNCAAGGYYGDQPGSNGGDGATAAFVATEVNGNWGTAQPVAGQPTGAADNTQIVALSCTRAGDCLAGGNSVEPPYANAMTGFTVEERDGTGLFTPIRGGYRSSTLSAVSCAKPGSCGIGGSMAAGEHGPAEAFVATEDGDAWHQARLLTGVAGSTALGSAVTALDCPAAGACTAGGYYATSQQAPDGNEAAQVFVVNQVRFTWGASIQVPGSAQANPYHDAGVAAVSCAAPGDCAVGGEVTTGADAATRGFVSTETRDSWQHQPLVPLAGAASYVAALDCPAIGSCVAADEVSARAPGGGPQPFMIQQAGQAWGQPAPLPGLSPPSGWSDDVNALSCAAPGRCSLGGDAAYMAPVPSRYPGAMLADDGDGLVIRS